MILENNLLTFFNSSLYDGTKPLTKQEVIYKVVEKLNLVILNFNKLEEITQSSITELKKQVNYYLDDGMKTELQKIINEMVTDGTFDYIINQTLFSEINNSIDELNIEVNEVDSNLRAYKITNNETVNNHISEFESFKTTVNDFITSYNEYKTNTIDIIKSEVEEIKEMNNTVKTVEELKNALNKGGVIYIEEGEYYVNKNDVLLFNSFTTLIGKGQVIFYLDTTAEQYIMFRPNLTGIEQGYSLRNIKFENIIFDGQNSTNKAGLLATAHCKYVDFKNCEFRKIKNSWHLVEINSSKSVTFTKCLFDQYNLNVGDSIDHTEAVQLDHAGSAAQYPFPCLMDGTGCEDITFNECEFTNITTNQTGCIGSHSKDRDKMPINVTISNSRFYNVDICVYAPDYKNLVLEKNVITNCASFLVIEPSDDSGRCTCTLTNNSYDGWGRYKNLSNMNGTNEGRFLFQLNPQYFLSNSEISGNKIFNAYSHGIGFTPSGCTVSNNTIKYCGKHGLYLYGSQQTSVVCNSGVGNGTLDSSTYHDLYISQGVKGFVKRSNITGNAMYVYSDGGSYEATNISGNLS